MARKRAGDGFNMSAAIREILGENREFSGQEAYEAVQQMHPGQDINRNSFSVAFSKARQELGIKGRRRKSVRRKKPGAVRRAPETVSNGPVNIEHLQAARKMIEAVGDAETAIRAIKQLQTLQIS